VGRGTKVKEKKKGEDADYGGKDSEGKGKEHETYFNFFGLLHRQRTRISMGGKVRVNRTGDGEPGEKERGAGHRHQQGP